MQDALDGGLYRDVGLVGEPKYDNAREPVWRVREDVGKIQIQRDEDPRFVAAHFNDALVRLTTKGLLAYRMSIVPGGLIQGRQGWREILVQFEFHAAVVSTTRSRSRSAA